MKQLRWKLMFVVLAGMWAGVGVRAATPFPNDCANVCGSTTACTHSCYPDQMAFMNDQPITCLEWGDYEDPCCGDGECSGGEDASSCFSDCHCGDSICNAGENSTTCPSDCTSGPGGGSGPGVCGDSVCNDNEHGGAGSPFENNCSGTGCSYCAIDCGGCSAAYCDPQVCEGTNGQCKDCTSDGQCYFSNEYCAFDGRCYQTETCTTSQDCANALGGTANDWYCDGLCKPVI